LTLKVRCLSPKFSVELTNKFSVVYFYIHVQNNLAEILCFNFAYCDNIIRAAGLYGAYLDEY